jgi:hypothetical protein
MANGSPDQRMAVKAEFAVHHPLPQDGMLPRNMTIPRRESTWKQRLRAPFVNRQDGMRPRRP